VKVLGCSCHRKTAIADRIAAYNMKFAAKDENILGSNI